MNPFCWRLIALIALALHSGSSGKGTSVTSWVIHLHSSSPLFSAGDQWREWMSYLPQTTLQGRGLDDISWNKAAESAEQSRSCWWVCKWAVSATESSLKNIPFQYVTSREKSSLLGPSHQTYSINCPLMSHRRMCWRPDVAPSCIKHHLLKTLSIYLYRLWQSCKYLCWIFQSFEEGVYVWREALGVAGTNPPHFCFHSALTQQRVSLQLHRGYVHYVHFGADCKWRGHNVLVLSWILGWILI